MNTPEFSSSGAPGARDPKLHGVVFVSLERVPIRTRGSAQTLSAWRLAATTPRGTGTIQLVEAAGGVSYFRGEGAFLGLSRAELEHVYVALRPPPPDPEPTVGQLG